MQDRANRRLGEVSSIQAEAIGAPGQRRFRLVLGSGAAAAYLWLEKEQLFQMAVYIQEVCASLSSGDRKRGQGAPTGPWSGGPTSIEIKVGKLALGRDPSSGAFLFLVHDAETAEDAPADLSFWVTLARSEDLSQEALKLCAAGRPRCFLCGQPINPEGHKCIRSNGHGSIEALDR